MDEKMKCEVVQDLLPLYVDGACTDGSKTLVEEHVKTCPGCKKLLEDMTAPLPEVPLREPTESEEVLRHTLKKMRMNSKRVVAVCLAILLMIPVVTLVGRELSGMGLCLSNYEEYRRTKNTMDHWVTTGGSAAVDSMSPLWLYNHIKTLRTDHWIFGRYNKSEAYDGDCSKGKYTCIELMGENFYFPGEGFREYAFGTPTRQHELELLEAGDELGVVYSLMQEGQIIVPEDLFQQVQNTHQRDWEDWYCIEFGGERYYFCSHGAKIGDELTWEEYHEILLVWVDLAPELYAMFPDQQVPDLIYCVAQNNQILPEKLQHHFEEVYDEIYFAYQSYNQYYENMGYDRFRDLWRGELKGLLEELEALGWSADSAELQSITRHVDQELKTYYMVTWRMEMHGKWVYVDFEVRDYGEGVLGSVCVPVRINCFVAPEEVQAIFDQINRLCGKGLSDLQNGVNVGMNSW